MAQTLEIPGGNVLELPPATHGNQTAEVPNVYGDYLRAMAEDQPVEPVYGPTDFLANLVALGPAGALLTLALGPLMNAIDPVSALTGSIGGLAMRPTAGVPGLPPLSPDASALDPADAPKPGKPYRFPFHRRMTEPITPRRVYHGLGVWNVGEEPQLQALNKIQREGLRAGYFANSPWAPFGPYYIAADPHDLPPITVQGAHIKGDDPPEELVPEWGGVALERSMRKGEDLPPYNPSVHPARLRLMKQTDTGSLLDLGQVATERAGKKATQALTEEQLDELAIMARNARQTQIIENMLQALRELPWE